MKTKLFSMFFLLIAISSHSQKTYQYFEKVNQQKSIIFETDIGNDIDDALALDMLYKYLDEKKIDVLAIFSNKESKYSTEYINLMNCWYGYPNIPIGKILNGIDCENDARNYAKHVSLMKDDHGNNLFKRSNYSYDELPEAVSLYRKVLSNQLDHSVTIISVGFSTNIVRLLNSQPDQYSKLNGIDLINKKVKLLSIMAGSFGPNAIPEYNIMKDIPAAKILVEKWPTQIVFSPYEAGIAVTYPSRSIENHFCWTKHHPLVEAYNYYLEMPYDRPTWDLIATLYAIENSEIYFTQSEWGTISVDNKGFTNFKRNKKGKHAYLTINETQAKETLSRFMLLITRIPKSQLIN